MNATLAFLCKRSTFLSVVSDLKSIGVMSITESILLSLRARGEASGVLWRHSHAKLRESIDVS